MQHISSTPEEWRPVVGYEGLYEVSDHGRVRSVPRTFVRSTGASMTVRGKVRKTYRAKSGHLSTSLSMRGVIRTHQIHALVLEAFVGDCPDGMEIRHLNGDPADNRLENLQYGTRSENVQDAINHGTAWEQSKTHCPHGHAYSGANLRVANWKKNGKRYKVRHCRACERAAQRKNVKDGSLDRRQVADEIYASLTAHKRYAHDDEPTGAYITIKETP